MEVGLEQFARTLLLRAHVTSEGGTAVKIRGSLPVPGPVKKSAGTGISRSVGIIYGSDVDR
jgi:hypothetical protein